ncbi:MAG: hypothetical protein QOG37_2904, partial [Mycobacterium sp.]|nr:hypothetical protein [Mycobacterium sp.]
AQQRERQLQDAMRRHPAYLGRQRAAGAGSSLHTRGRNFDVYSSGDTPA